MKFKEIMEGGYDDGLLIMPNTISEVGVLRDLKDYVNSPQFKVKDLQKFLDKKLKKEYLNDKTKH
jgi:hypothetical protein